MEIEGTYSFNIAVVGPNDELNSKFLNVIAETHGRVDGVEFHQSKISRVAALVYWQPHEDSMSPILVSHSLKTANGAIIVMIKKSKKNIKKYRKLIKENAGKIPVKEVIFKPDMNLDEIGELAFGSIKDLAAQLIIEAEQKSRKETVERLTRPREVEEIAGKPRFYIDDYGMVTSFKMSGSIPLFQDEVYAKTDKIHKIVSDEKEEPKKSMEIEKNEKIEDKPKKIIEKEKPLEIKEIDKPKKTKSKPKTIKKSKRKTNKKKSKKTTKKMKK